MRIFKHGLDFLLSEIEDSAERFRGAEEIGSSDVSCAVCDVLRMFYKDPSEATSEEFKVVRTGVNNAIGRLH